MSYPSANLNASKISENDNKIDLFLAEELRHESMNGGRACKAPWEDDDLDREEALYLDRFIAHLDFTKDFTMQERELSHSTLGTWCKSSAKTIQRVEKRLRNNGYISVIEPTKSQQIKDKISNKIKITPKVFERYKKKLSENKDLMRFLYKKAEDRMSKYIANMRTDCSQDEDRLSSSRGQNVQHRSIPCINPSLNPNTEREKSINEDCTHERQTAFLSQAKACLKTNTEQPVIREEYKVQTITASQAVPVAMYIEEKTGKRFDNTECAILIEQTMEQTDCSTFRQFQKYFIDFKTQSPLVYEIFGLNNFAIQKFWDALKQWILRKDELMVEHQVKKSRQAEAQRQLDQESATARQKRAVEREAKREKASEVQQSEGKKEEQKVVATVSYLDPWNDKNLVEKANKQREALAERELKAKQDKATREALIANFEKKNSIPEVSNYKANYL